MPTMQELYNHLEHLVEEVDGISREAYEYANGNAETLLSYYAIPSPHDQHTEVLRKQLVAFQLENAIGDFLQEREAAGSDVIAGDSPATNLIRKWDELQSQVLTTNYDTLVERIAASIERPASNGRAYRLRYEDLYPIPISRAKTREPVVMWGSGYPDTFTLYKLHGSITWFKSGSGMQSDPIYGLSHDEILDPSSRKFIADKRRFIVPPVYDKSSLLNHESIRNLWWQSKNNALKPADSLYVIGYSLPETDAAMHVLLWEGTENQSNSNHQKKPLYIINKDDDVVQRYANKLGRYYDVNDCYAGIDDAFDKFVGDYVSDQ